MGDDLVKRLRDHADAQEVHAGFTSHLETIDALANFASDLREAADALEAKDARFSSLERELAAARAPKRWEVVRQYHPTTGGGDLLTIHGVFDTHDAAQIAALIINRDGMLGACAYVRPNLSTTRSDGEAK